MTRQLKSLLGLAFGLGFASMAQAGFLTYDVQAVHLYPDLATVDDGTPPYVATVGAGTEFSFYSGFYTADLTDSSIIFAFPGAAGSPWLADPQAFNGSRFFDVNSAIDKILSVSFTTDISGFDAARVTWNDDYIWVNLESLTMYDTSTLTLDVTFEQASSGGGGGGGGGGGSVPEPATLALLGLGLLGLGVMRRKA